MACEVFSLDETVFIKIFIKIKFATKYTNAGLRLNASEHVDDNSFLLAAISKKRYFCST